VSNKKSMRGFHKACRKRWSHSKWEICIKKLKESLMELIPTPSVIGIAWICAKSLTAQLSLQIKLSEIVKFYKIASLKSKVSYGSFMCY
jgi:hypothetical protein